ncbi:Ketocytochalasin monooxygenase [Clarias magur]|uniref:Ketocytochalasin monooxygenase n=1 Tax=Clarias magur TaxID=1594786 RepID=A0A8J4UTW6_CLAMG|nr:Ketocytochalasin monooxygenase [Clarias magur]
MATKHAFHPKTHSWVRGTFLSTTDFSRRTGSSDIEFRTFGADAEGRRLLNRIHFIPGRLKNNAYAKGCPPTAENCDNRPQEGTTAVTFYPTPDIQWSCLEQSSAWHRSRGTRALKKVAQATGTCDGSHRLL